MLGYAAASACHEQRGGTSVLQPDVQRPRQAAEHQPVLLAVGAHRGQVHCTSSGIAPHFRRSAHVGSATNEQLVVGKQAGDVHAEHAR